MGSRSHGFPSPLLDWSQSYRVAAFFAFKEVLADNVAIYVFSERPKNIKVGSSDAPYIYGLGPNVKAHPRHFLQKSEYTMCCLFKDDQIQVTSHQDVFADATNDQDVVWKFVIPSSERIKVLQMFDDFNLNAYSLFGTEESLLETIAMRELF
ncbi:MAG: FRG domain-containing protein [Rhodospirillaceae bacterium]|nr:MAG: FRG domain-containing protein [Rhodospirillaceae bacterium]